MLAIAFGGAIQPANAETKSTTVALTTTVSAHATEVESTMMANLLALFEVSVLREAGIDVVDRLEIDSVLHELVLNRAAASEEDALRLGKIALADVIVTTRLLSPADDGKRNVLVRVTESRTGRIRGATVAPVSESIIEETAEEITNYLSAVLTTPETAGITVAVAPFESIGRFDRLRPLERGLRDMVVARLLKYRRFHVLQRSDMRELLDEIDLARMGLSDSAESLEALPDRRAAYFLRGSIDERNSDDAQRLNVAMSIVNANTSKIVDSVEFQSTPIQLPQELPKQIHRLASLVAADAGRHDDALSEAPQFDEVDHLLQLAVSDLHRFWRRKPRDFSHRDFRFPSVAVPKRAGGSRVPIDSPLGTAILRKSADRLESVLYLQPDRTEAAFALAFCMICHIDGLWEPERANRLLRNVYHRDPTRPIAAESLNLIAEMYYHHENGRLQPKYETAAAAQLRYAFENMPDTHRNYEWSRLAELLMNIYGGKRDQQAMAELLRLAADFAAEPGDAQRNLASLAIRMAEWLIAVSQKPRLQTEARQLLERWSQDKAKWLRYFALQAKARSAERQSNLDDAVAFYRQAGAIVQDEANNHDMHVMLMRAAATLRKSGDAKAALALLQSFKQRDRRPTSLLNGRYGEELGVTLEALGRKQEALETYVSYAENCAHLVDNSDVESRIERLGGVPLREDREVDVRYIDLSEDQPLRCRFLATDGRMLYVGGSQAAGWNGNVAALNLQSGQWEEFGGPQGLASCLAYDAGYLWAGTEGQGLWRCHLATKAWKNWKLADGLPDDRVVDVVADGELAYVSVGSRDSGGIVRVDSNDAIHIYESNGAPEVALSHLTIHDGQLHGINRRMYTLNLEAGSWTNPIHAKAKNGFGLMGLFAAGPSLYGSTYGREVVRLNSTAKEDQIFRQAWFPRGLGRAGYVVDFMFERSGQLWFGGSPWWRFKSVGLYRLDLETGDFAIFGPRDGFRMSPTYECYDGLRAGGRIWLATSAGLAEVSPRPEKTSLTSEEGLSQ